MVQLVNGLESVQGRISSRKKTKDSISSCTKTWTIDRQCAEEEEVA